MLCLFLDQLERVVLEVLRRVTSATVPVEEGVKPDGVLFGFNFLQLEVRRQNVLLLIEHLLRSHCAPSHDLATVSQNCESALLLA